MQSFRSFGEVEYKNINCAVTIVHCSSALLIKDYVLSVVSITLLFVYQRL